MSVQSIRSASLLAALVLVAAAFPSSLPAQQGATDDRGSPAAQVSTISTPAPVVSAHPVYAPGPRIAPAGATRPVMAHLPDPAPPYDGRMGAGSNIALMSVGAAAVVVGLLVGGEGGTMLALGGGVIGLVGLYRYVR